MLGELVCWWICGTFSNLIREAWTFANANLKPISFDYQCEVRGLKAAPTLPFCSRERGGHQAIIHASLLSYHGETE